MITIKDWPEVIAERLEKIKNKIPYLPEPGKIDEQQFGKLIDKMSAIMSQIGRLKPPDTFWPCAWLFIIFCTFSFIGLRILEKLDTIIGLLK
jgi:hypothetical protein